MWASQREILHRWLDETRPVPPPRPPASPRPAHGLSSQRRRAFRGEVADHQTCSSCGQADGRHARSCQLIALNF